MKDQKRSKNVIGRKCSILYTGCVFKGGSVGGFKKVDFEVRYNLESNQLNLTISSLTLVKYLFSKTQVFSYLNGNVKDYTHEILGTENLA